MIRAAAALCALVFLPLVSHAQAVQASEFGWRAPLEIPANASIAQVALPASALVRLQAADARDVRVFNAAGEAVAFSFIGIAARVSPPARTSTFKALPLFSSDATNNAGKSKGAMQVRIGDADRSVWVQIDGKAPEASGARPVNSVVVDLRTQKQWLSGLVLQGNLPANTPVQFSVYTSSDLTRWSDAPVRGRLYRFEGAGAPANDTLELDAPLSTEGKYLRIDWGSQEGVSVESVTGVVASSTQPPQWVRAELPVPRAESKGVEIQLPFATPMASLTIATARPNALLPVRVLARNEVSQPWRQIAQALVYRVGATGSEVVNPPLALYGASARLLRIESTNGADLANAQLTANAEFAPVQIAFVATGSAPFTLAAGRASTQAADLPAALLASTLNGKRLEDLPKAVVGAPSMTADAAPDDGFLARLRPAGVSERAAILWAVLIAGVLLLGGVAVSLMRQLKKPE